MSGKEEILTAARSLAETIKNSGIYRDYRSSLLKVHEQPVLALRLQMFKQLQAEVEPGQPITFEKEKDISHRYTELVYNSDASVFLSAESEMLKVYTAILDIIDEACEIELF